MIKIQEASEKLYNLLEEYTWLMGMGIMTNDGHTKIVVYVEDMDYTILQIIPKNFDGFEVRTRNYKTSEMRLKDHNRKRIL